MFTIPKQGALLALVTPVPGKHTSIEGNKPVQYMLKRGQKLLNYDVNEKFIRFPSIDW